MGHCGPRLQDSKVIYICIALKGLDGRDGGLPNVKWGSGWDGDRLAGRLASSYPPPLQGQPLAYHAVEYRIGARTHLPGRLAKPHVHEADVAHRSLEREGGANGR